ncbi:MAG: hypothetical protein ACXW0H_08145 [Methylobacter sp.]
MRRLILQIVIKQWDKSQRTEAYERLRAAIPDHYPIIFPPAFYVFDKQCVIDQHGDDIQGGRLKYAKVADQTIKFDRFQICLTDKVMAYVGAKSNETPRIMGSLDNRWIQCKYNGRQSIFESDRYYWLYEEVTVNAICLSKLNEKVFLSAEPAIVYTDFNDLDTISKAWRP